MAMIARDDTGLVLDDRKHRSRDEADKGGDGATKDRCS